MRIVLDADVLIGALDASDPHHATARMFFTSWRDRGDAFSVSVVNLSEVLVAPAADRQRLQRARVAIAALGVEIHQPSEAIGVAAARLRHAHPISLGDAYCLATARQTRASLASFDANVIRAARAERIAVVRPPVSAQKPQPRRRRGQ